MTVRERIKAQIDVLDEAQVAEVYALVQHLAEAAHSRQAKVPSLMSRLRSISIEGPEDFASNIDLYLNGEKQA